MIHLGCDTTHSHVTWLLQFDMTYSYVTWPIHTWHDTFICGMTFPYAQRVDVEDDPFICDMTHSYVTWHIHMWHDVCIRAASRRRGWPIHMWHDPFICDVTHSYVTWRFHMRSQSRSSMHVAASFSIWNSTRLIHTWHDSFIFDTTHSNVTWPIPTWLDYFICDMMFSYTQPVKIVDACCCLLFHLGNDMTRLNVKRLLHMKYDLFTWTTTISHEIRPFHVKYDLFM